ncbi:DinB family protein [Kribbella sp. NPDC004875]|uniref:DinB family protein n=1 Tax=Kribbella sp. NPDC004875 TaxID=3364107 RepID=UPI00367A75CF
MTKFGRTDDLQGAEFVEANLKGARFNEVNLKGAQFIEADLSGVVMRGIDLQGADLDSPWLTEAGGSMIVNGVDVAPLVEAELNRRFPGRGERRAQDPEAFRAAFAKVEAAWAAAQARAAAMPEGTVDVSVGGEWSFAQTQRHLVHATDIWFGSAILELDEPHHPIGLRYGGTDDGTSPVPTYAEVLEARAGRLKMVRDYLAEVTAADLESARKNPHAPEHPETVGSCLRVILHEEWEHLRFATRDLDTIDSNKAT